MKVIMSCPFCNEQHCVTIDGDGYHCTSCEFDFTEDDCDHELLRQQISCVCSGEEATEEAPIDCTKDGALLTIGDDESQGLSDLEKTRVVGVFQDFEGVVWVNIEGIDEPQEADMLSTSDLQTILDWLEENYGVVTPTEFMWVYNPR